MIEGSITLWLPDTKQLDKVDYDFNPCRWRNFENLACAYAFSQNIDCTSQISNIFKLLEIFCNDSYSDFRMQILLIN